MMMRIVLWLAIIVFVSSLFWSQLLNNGSIIYCLLLFFLLFARSRLRFFAIIPLSAIYFTFYAALTLTGSLPIPLSNIHLPFVNMRSLQTLVDGKAHDVLVQVHTLISAQNRGYFTAQVMAIDGDTLNYSPLLTMRWYRPTVNVQSGEQHEFSVRFKPVNGYANPAGFDRQKWLFSQHTAYQAIIKEHLGKHSKGTTVRAGFYQKVQLICASLNNQGIILALSFADKTLIAPTQKELIKKLGIAHLFAISGLHIGLLFSWLYLLLHLFFARFIPCRYLGWNDWRLFAFCALVGAFFYAYLAGFSLPTQRAFVMLFLAISVLSMKRKSAGGDLLSVTLFVILLWDPLAVLSLSLWLSFSAVAIILTVLWRFPNIMAQQKEEHSPHFSGREYLKFLFLIQIALALLMSPLQLLNFSAYNYLSPLVNLFAVPIFSMIIIPLILLATLSTLMMPAFALFLFSCADYLLSLFFTFFAPAALAYHSYSVSQSQLIVLLLSLLVLLYIIYFQVHSNRKTGLVFTAVVFVLVGISIWQREDESTDTWFVEVLDIGQGLAVLVRSQGQTLLYDSGPRYPSGFSAASSEIEPYLNSLGIEQLDYFVISHSDIDHAGGVDVINAYFSPKKTMMGETFMNQKGGLCQAGQKWSLGALQVEVLSPSYQNENNNNNSCVLRLSDGNHALLLTGDIEKKQEYRLIGQYAARLQSELLVAPHHGSQHSSSDPFIEAVSPQWVIFSAGFMNRWGFPAKEVKSRYKNRSVNMVNSGLSGFVRFKITKEQIKMQTYREDLAAYWYHHSFSF